MSKQNLVQYLLKIGANEEYIWLLDRLEFNNNVILEWASIYGYISIIKYLVKNGCNPNNDWALTWASENGYIDIVRYLVKNGCNPNNKIALELASQNGHWEIVECLKNEQTKTNTISS